MRSGCLAVDHTVFKCGLDQYQHQYSHMDNFVNHSGTSDALEITRADRASEKAKCTPRVRESAFCLKVVSNMSLINQLVIKNKNFSTRQITRAGWFLTRPRKTYFSAVQPSLVVCLCTSVRRMWGVLHRRYPLRKTEIDFVLAALYNNHKRCEY